MEVQSGVLGFEAVDQVQLDSVALLDSQSRQGPRVVEPNHLSFKGTIGVGIDPAGLEPPGMGFGTYERCDEGKEQKRSQLHDCKWFTSLNVLICQAATRYGKNG